MEPEHLRDDLRSEVMVILLEQPPGRIERLHSTGQLLFFAIRTVLNTIQSKTSTFAKVYRNGKVCELQTNLSIPAPVLNGRAVKEALEDPLYTVLQQVKRLAHQENPSYLRPLEDIGVTWYKQYILSLYMKLGTFRRIESETGIPWESCYKTYRETITLLRQHYATHH